MTLHSEDIANVLYKIPSQCMRTQTLGAPRDLATSIPSLDPEVVRKPAINPSCRPQIDLKGVVNIFFREIAEYVVVVVPPHKLQTCSYW